MAIDFYNIATAAGRETPFHRQLVNQKDNAVPGVGDHVTVPGDDQVYVVVRRRWNYVAPGEFHVRVYVERLH